MSTSSLASAFGFAADGSLTPGSKFLTVLPSFLHLKDLPLDQVALQQAGATFKFLEPFSFSSGVLQLQVGANVAGSLDLRGHRNWVLDEDDPFAAIAIDASEFYVGLGLDVSTTGGGTVTVDTISFGLSLDHDLSLKCYRRFVNTSGAFPAFATAFAATASLFTVPTSAASLAALPADLVVVIAGQGALTVNGGFTVATPVQTLASVSLPAGKTLDINPSGSFAASATLTLTGGYQIRLRQAAPRKIEIGVYTLKSRELDLSITAEAGVSTEVGTFDLAAKFLAALSRQPIVDLDEFKKALPGEDEQARDEQIEGFQATLKASISTSVQASVTAAFSNLKSNEAAWTFEIDLDAAVSDQAHSAITSALRGDFRPLTADPNHLPPGITQTANILTQANVHKQELQVNLLGVVNFLSLTKLVRTSTIERNATGAITLITDTSSASRLHALIVIAALDKKRLRKMLSEKFVIEAAYHAAGLQVLPPEFQAEHAYFDVNDHTGKQDLKNYLDVARILALISPDEENRRLNGSDFGRTTFYAGTKYTSKQARALFLDENGQPRDASYYETAGRSALKGSLNGDSGQEFRERFANLGTGDALWNQMKALGNTSAFGPLFGLPAGSTDPRVQAAGSDYLMIVTWASAMHKAAVGLHDVEALLGQSPVAFDDPRLTNARAELKKRMEEVVKDTHDHFGDPLGLLMVYVAAQKSADVSVILSGTQVEPLQVNSEQRVMAQTAKSS
jgi:hypothetical protein